MSYSHALNISGEGNSQAGEIIEQMLDKARTVGQSIIKRTAEFGNSMFGVEPDGNIAIGGLMAAIEKEEIPAEDPDEVAKRDGVKRNDTVKPRGTDQYSSPSDDPDTGSRNVGRKRGHGRNPQES